MNDGNINQDNGDWSTLNDRNYNIVNGGTIVMNDRHDNKADRLNITVIEGRKNTAIGNYYVFDSTPW